MFVTINDFSTLKIGDIIRFKPDEAVNRNKIKIELIVFDMFGLDLTLKRTDNKTIITLPHSYYKYYVLEKKVKGNYNRPKYEFKNKR